MKILKHPLLNMTDPTDSFPMSTIVSVLTFWTASCRSHKSGHLRQSSSIFPTMFRINLPKDAVLRLNAVEGKGSSRATVERLGS